ncbi:MAG TPA: hypothetical protein ENN09_07500, partial [Planctomycetes bacterium]|nr:hypothetical protein [Planctomycetota bacterium]
MSRDGRDAPAAFCRDVKNICRGKPYTAYLDTAAQKGVKMEKVVYFLGAGFSAPLGIPTMRDFLTRSKDLFATDPHEYESFKNIFDTIQKMSYVKNFYNTDLFNIEEILSILEMEDTVKDKNRSSAFAEYIKSVIRYYTPPMPKPALTPEISVSEKFWYVRES